MVHWLFTTTQFTKLIRVFGVEFIPEHAHQHQIVEFSFMKQMVYQQSFSI